MHDARIGRYFALDPLASKYPHNSPYAFSENVVIDHIELEDLEKAKPDGSADLESTKIENQQKTEGQLKQEEHTGVVKSIPKFSNNNITIKEPNPEKALGAVGASNDFIEGVPPLVIVGGAALITTTMDESPTGFVFSQVQTETLKTRGQDNLKPLQLNGPGF